MKAGPIVITGFMACGKTRVARELAQRLSLRMADLDEWIRERSGRSPAQLIVEDGEAAFRSIESNALHELLQSDLADVIALGGGAWIEEANRALVDQYGGFSIWIDAPFEVCWARIEASGNRPLGKDRNEALARYERRRPIYQLANLHFEADGTDFENLISRIMSRLESAGLPRRNNPANPVNPV
jgi:shikimate kinase